MNIDYLIAEKWSGQNPTCRTGSSAPAGVSIWRYGAKNSAAEKSPASSHSNATPNTFALPRVYAHAILLTPPSARLDDQRVQKHSIAERWLRQRISWRLIVSGIQLFFDTYPCSGMFLRLSFLMFPVHTCTRSHTHVYISIIIIHRCTIVIRLTLISAYMYVHIICA